MQEHYYLLYFLDIYRNMMYLNILHGEKTILIPQKVLAFSQSFSLTRPNNSGTSIPLIFQQTHGICYTN